MSKSGAAPQAWAILTHGIFGSGGNWRTIARRLVERRPDWGAVLVDLRMHGRSQGMPPPHTLASAAADLAALVAWLGEGGREVRAVCGHSFGGKVALAHRPMAAETVAQTWMFDASPSARPGAMPPAGGRSEAKPAGSDEGGTVVKVLGLLEALPPVLASREDFVARMTAASIWPGIAQWLALNLERRGEGFSLRLELPAIRALLVDYYSRDLWALAERGPGVLHVVAAERDSALSADDVERLDHIRGVREHRVPDAGHWVHVDAPDVVLGLLADELPPA
jgi:pimeloyl-ACP methyl ester carboxylesterase